MTYKYNSEDIILHIDNTPELVNLRNDVMQRAFKHRKSLALKVERLRYFAAHTLVPAARRDYSKEFRPCAGFDCKYEIAEEYCQRFVFALLMECEADFALPKLDKIPDLMLIKYYAGQDNNNYPFYGYQRYEKGSLKGSFPTKAAAEGQPRKITFGQVYTNFSQRQFQNDHTKDLQVWFNVQLRDNYKPSHVEAPYTFRYQLKERSWFQRELTPEERDLKPKVNDLFIKILEDPKFDFDKPEAYTLPEGVTLHLKEPEP
jgi:hypothetical protein